MQKQHEEVSLSWQTLSHHFLKQIWVCGES
jgi:hypothetical protein